jgi:prolipoprotein diacylglyceryltransferase
MVEQLFIGISGLIFLTLLVWGFRVLPGERWQMLAAIPRYKEGQNGHGQWRGLNLTFYGFLLAGATVIAVLFGLILLTSASAYLPGVLAVFLLIFAVSLPASKILARVVEKKRHTFTVGGAFFSGLLFAPWAVVAVNLALRIVHAPELPVLVVLATLAISYTLGEGLGRLACLSFGCCYGKPLKECHWLTRKLFANFAFVFTGATKKAVYDGGLEGEKLLPIQALTSILYTATALFSTHLFLHGQYGGAFFLSLIVSQLWRFFSETLRADFRGLGRISVYQKMSLLAVPYAGAIIFLIPAADLPLPSIIHGLSTVLQPVSLIGLQLLWLTIFLIFGLSTATTSTVSFQVVKTNQD